MTVSALLSGAGTSPASQITVSIVMPSSGATASSRIIVPGRMSVAVTSLPARGEPQGQETEAGTQIEHGTTDQLFGFVVNRREICSAVQ